MVKDVEEFAIVSFQCEITVLCSFQEVEVGRLMGKKVGEGSIDGLKYT
jgi:hypothetical protein